MAVKPVPRQAKARTKYKFGVDHYAQLYEIPRATITKYHRKDYPLDDPAALLETIMAQKAANKPNTKRLREIVAQKTTKRLDPRIEAAAMLEASKRGSPLEDEPPKEPESDRVGDALEGLQRELHRLKVETDEAYRAYRREPDAILKSAHWKTWKEMLEQWAKLAKVAPAAEAEAGTMAKCGDIESTWSRTFKEVRTQLESMKRRLSQTPVFKALNPVDVEVTIETEILKVMTLLSEGDFLKPKDE